MNIQRNFFPYVILTLLLFLAFGSFYRFMVLNDYVVAFEGECNPSTESCFVGCEDEECTTQYYYSVIERHANEVMELCGPDILECEAAYSCDNSVEICSVTYCDPQIDGDEACFFLTDNL